MHEPKCGIKESSREYEEWETIHSVRHHGQAIVVDHAPAEVCSVCGNVLLKRKTVRSIEALFRVPTRPVDTVPLYDSV